MLQETTNAPDRVLARADRHRRIGAADGSWETSAADILSGAGDDDQRLDLVAAAFYAFTALAEDDNEPVEVEEGWNSEWVAAEYEVGTFTTTVNDILLGARVDWIWDGRNFQQRGNYVLHASVVKPASSLLDLNPKFARTSAGFEAALTRLSENKPAVAITDAATAVQEFFRALGIEGGSISEQLNNAANEGVISQLDRKLLKPFIDWENGERSARGNAHQFRDDDVTKADAWLAIHVAAALIVRLSDEDPRDIERLHEKRAAERRQWALEEEARARAHEESNARKTTESAWGPPSPYDDEVPF
ncbi:hypothetical protein [Curtobacterium sp. MCBD17_023]|uniref:hypothetical protein n=1 Tax=Curtobacterium sp. MCBD17_023 TaxID=2175657 RepID=UPI0011B4C6EE|nr:hypothetical protein [Curtobacterium sp. MCBD17_023]